MNDQSATEAKSRMAAAAAATTGHVLTVATCSMLHARLARANRRDIQVVNGCKIVNGMMMVVLASHDLDGSARNLGDNALGALGALLGRLGGRVHWIVIVH